MNYSLRDQLLAAGLVPPKPVRESPPRPKQIPSHPGKQNAKPGPQPQGKRSAEQLEKHARRARFAQIEQLIERDRLPRLECEQRFFFIDGRKIRRMSADADRRAKLTSGELMIARYKGHYAVVPAATTAAIRQLDEKMVVTLVQPTGADQDEAYKDFVVPDDLMW